MDIHIDVSKSDATFGLYAAAGYELTCGGLSLAMNADQFQQLCDHLRPWIVEDATRPAPAPSPVAGFRIDPVGNPFLPPVAAGLTGEEREALEWLESLTSDARETNMGRIIAAALRRLAPAASESGNG